MKTRRNWVALSAVVIIFQLTSLVAFAAEPNFNNNQLFRSKWIEQDGLVGVPGINRPYTWGPNVEGAPVSLTESYQESPGGSRTVLYLEKARMELNNPSAGLVTSGLLVKELVSGRQQDGDNKFTTFKPSTTQVAGDPVAVNPSTPTYSSFKDLVTLGGADAKSKPSAIGTVVNQFVNKAGTTSGITPPEAITVGRYDSVTGHNVAAPFVFFQNQRGPIINPINGVQIENQPIYTADPISNVFGYAISEPYWVDTLIAGKNARVLTQLFERRAVTYNPGLAENKVEMGNVGIHYYTWRYIEDRTSTPPPPPPPTGPVAPYNFTQYLANYHVANGVIPTGGVGNVQTYNAGSAVNSSPAIIPSKNLAVIGTSTNGLQGININTLSNVFTFKPAGTSSFSGVPLVAGNTIYAGGSDSRVYAISIDATGSDITEQGKTGLVGGGAVSGIAIDPAGTQIYYTINNRLYAVSVGNLTDQNWVQTLNGTASEPIVDPQGNIYVGTPSNSLYAFKPDGTPLSASFPVGLTGGIERARPSFNSGFVYVATNNGRISKINIGNGTIAWTAITAPVGDIDSSPAVLNGFVYISTFNNQAGKGEVIKMRDSNGEIVGGFPLNSTNASSVAVVDNFLYVTDEGGELYKADINNFANRTTILSTSLLYNTNSPVIVNGKAYIASSTGIFYIVK